MEFLGVLRVLSPSDAAPTDAAPRKCWIQCQQLLSIASCVSAAPCCCCCAPQSMRVGDFNGKNLSSVSSSTVLIDPDRPEAHQLKAW